MINSFDFKVVLDNIFSEDTHEYEIIKEAHDIITNNAPTISSEMKTQMILIDRCRTELSTLYFMLNRSIAKLEESYRSTYDKQYTRLVKLGRPSGAAIEAELRSSLPDYVVASEKINTLNSVKDLVSSYMRCLDSRKQTITEIFRDSRRID